MTLPAAPTFAPSYAGGWQNLPSLQTPIVAAALDNYDGTLLALVQALAQTIAYVGTLHGGGGGLAPFTKSLGPTGSGADYEANGSNDSAQFTAAVNAVSAAGGGILHVKRGTYWGTGANLGGAAAFLIQDTVNVTIICEPGTVLKMTANTDANLLHVQHNTGLRIHGRLQLDGNKANQSLTPAHGANFYAVGNGSVGNIDCCIDDVWTHDAAQHNFIFKDTAGRHSNIHIGRLLTHNAGQSGTPNGSGCYIYGVDNLFVREVYTHDNILDGFQTKTCSDVQVGMVQAYNNARYGLYQQDGYWQIGQVIVRGSGSIGIFHELGTDATFSPANPTSADIQLATVSGCGTDGIRVHNVSNVGYGSIRSKNNGQAGSGAGLRLTADSAASVTRIRVVGASLYDDQVTATQEWGFYATGAGTVDYTKVTIGEAYGNVIADVLTSTWGANNAAPMMLNSPRLTEMNLPSSAMVGLFEQKRSITDGVTTNASTTFTSATAAFTSADTGDAITGPNIPAGTTMTYVSATQVTLSNAATASGTALAVTLWGNWPNRPAYDGTVWAVGAESPTTGGTTAGGAGIVNGLDYDIYTA